MGNSSSQLQKSRKTSSSSFHRQSSQMTEIINRIDQKECVFIAMQGEIDKAITQNNRQAMKSLAAEIAAHIMDLNQIKNVEIPSNERGRCQRVIYNFELSLAKLKSILSSDTAVARKIQSRSPENSQFYIGNVDPDIVSDLIRFDSIDSRRNTLSTLPEHQAAPSHATVSRNNTLYSKPSESAEEVFDSVEKEFGIIKTQLDTPIEAIQEYYQIDKGIFYLQIRLKNAEVPQGSSLNERKFRLLKELTEFRQSLDQKSGEFEALNDITQLVNTLELLVDSATEAELESLKARALLLEETIEKSTWDQTKKVELLSQLARILEKVSSSSSSYVEHLYGNLNALQEQIKALHGRGLENHDEAIYGNAASIKACELQRSGSKASQRGTVYVNAEIVDSNYEAHNIRDVINKRPLPLPRNYDNKVINDLPRYWQRLNEIWDSGSLSETDKLEAMEIQKHAELAKNLFERKIKQIVEKCEDCIEL